MRITIVRPTVVKPVGAEPRSVEPGDVVDVDQQQAQMLIALRKAVMAPAEPVALAGVERAVDPAALHAEKRKRTPHG
jgi:hypothetical protein